MCHDDDSRPPAPPLQGEVAARADLRLAAADGNRLLAHGARAGTPIGTGAVVMPDVRGLHAYPNSGAVAEQVVGAAVYMSDAECNAIATPLSQLSTFLLVRLQPFALTRQVDKQ